MLDVLEIERVLTAIDAKRAKDSLAIWTIDQLVWPFGSRQEKLDAGKAEILKLLIQCEVDAFLVIDEEDEMVRVPHAHQWKETGLDNLSLASCWRICRLDHFPTVAGLSMEPGPQWTPHSFKIQTGFHLLSVFKNFGALACIIFFAPSQMILAAAIFSV